MATSDRRPVEWEYTYTTDGEEWHSKYFQYLSDARDFAEWIATRNESNKEFNHFARRMVVVATSDFFDRSKPDPCIRMAW